MSAGVILIAGARPNFMKVAPIASALREDGRLESAIVHTGQHYDPRMSAVFFEQLGIPEPEVTLDVGSASHARQTAEVMLRLEGVLVERRPRAVVVVGDVNSTLAAALTAAKLGIRVAHVEAGLRSFDRSMPEELNRIVTDALSDWLFVSERSGLENLAREGVDASRVHFVGNVMIDTLRACEDRARSLGMPARMGLDAGRYAVLTLHRPANVDDHEVLAGLLAPVRELAETMPVVFPVHPRLRGRLRESGVEDDGRLRVLEPLGYLEFLGLMAEARVVLTDSGGIQEETTVLGVACVTLRENTERPATVTSGTNRLAGVDPEGVRRAIRAALDASGRRQVPELWDGRAAHRIVEILAREIVTVRS